MDANQLAEALARAVEAARPAVEYCLLSSQDRWWTVCMTKAEWSGWMQVIGSVAALVIALWLPYHQKRKDASAAFVLAKHCIASQCALLLNIGADPARASFRAETLASKESVASLLRLYAQVPPSLLPARALIAWMHAQTTAGQLSELVRSIHEHNLPDRVVEQSIGHLKDSS